MLPRRIAVAASAAVLAAVPAAAWLSPATASPAPQDSSADTSSSGPPEGPPQGSFALSGAEARSFELPDDLRAVRTTGLSNGRTATRYQQVVDGGAVFGGQVTIVKSSAGDTVAAIGAYFPGLEAKNTARHGRAEARDVVEARIGGDGRWSTRLRLDPRTARLFYEVESIRAAHRPVRWVDAATGKIRRSFDAVAHGEGIGVQGDEKSVETSANPDGGYVLATADGRQATYDAENRAGSRGTLMTDENDVWDFTRHNYSSPDQRPGVDAHFYAGLVDQFYADTFGRDSIDDEGMQIVSTVHYDRGYCNAFWNGVQMTYGDGDGRTCLPLSGGLDVVGHELTHGVTDFTSDLIYEGESGALNEAISDMMGNTIEYYAEAQPGDPDPGAPDFRIGEDVIVDTAGFRNMGDPQEFGDPDHYSERYTGTADNGGVHINSGIANHAYYLAVNGGRNAGCGSSPSGHSHQTDCDVTVSPVGLDRAQHVFHDGFTSLPEFANMCDARNATTAVAGEDRGSISTAWAAVGVHDGCTPGTPPPPPCEGDDTASIPFESPHPYGNNGDCTWTYDNGAPGFAFHFSMLETEAGFDYVYVKDADGNVLAEYDGPAVRGRRGLTSPCIPTGTGSVQLVTDGSVTAPGFVVDALEACTP
ncbi:MAG: M4 family metallopeptidase [Actinomycetota bacterium]|nr:M4 family metallopeptidase [Actinomycetota bacterium]